MSIRGLWLQGFGIVVGIQNLVCRKVVPELRTLCTLEECHLGCEITFMFGSVGGQFFGNFRFEGRSD